MKLHLTDVDVNSQNAYGTAVHWAAGYEHNDALQLLLQFGGDSTKPTPLEKPPCIGQHAAKSPVHLDCWYSTMVIQTQSLTLAGLLYIVLHVICTPTHLTELLIQHRGDPNRANQRGETAVHEAAQNGHADTLLLLLQHGGDTSRANNQGQAPMAML